MSDFVVALIGAVVSSNVITSAGFGAISLQSEKRNFLYMLVSTLATIVCVILFGLLYYVIDRFVLVALGAEYLRLFIVTLFAVLGAFISRVIIRAATREMFFLYEKSYGFAMQTIVTAGTLLIMNWSGTFLMTMFYLAMFSLGFLAVQIIFYAIYEKIDNTRVLKPARNIPLLLYTISILGMILTVAFAL